MVTEQLDGLIEEGAAVAPVLDDIRAILEADVEEHVMGEMMRTYVKESLTDIDRYSVVIAMLSATKVISAYNMRRVMES